MGKTNKVIAVEMGVSLETVKNELYVMYRKMGAVDRAHAVYLGMKRGLID